MVAIKTDFEIENFIESLSLPRNIAIGILTTEEECNEFHETHYGKNRYAVDDLLDYREDKIESLGITLDTFLDMCYNKGLIEAFEKTFIQRFSLEDITMVSDAISDGKTSLHALFVDFQKNPNKNIMKNVL